MDLLLQVQHLAAQRSLSLNNKRTAAIDRMKVAAGTAHTPMVRNWCRCGIQLVDLLQVQHLIA